MSKPMSGLAADPVSGAADGKAVTGWRNDLVQNAAEGRKRDAYLGIDVGSISTKGVILNDEKEILASAYIWTEGNPIGAVKQLVSLLEQQFDKTSYRVVATGTTGSARRLAGTITGATLVKNEITAHAVGTTSFYP
ncbi:MAG: hypothetical protein LUH20_09400, partial [Lachnospiraceae bacterium]|nr:hypothetical protein [Lachnospiraceae bacterium]